MKENKISFYEGRTVTFFAVKGRGNIRILVRRVLFEL